jgi:hypothetical protein
MKRVIAAAFSLLIVFSATKDSLSIGLLAS